MRAIPVFLICTAFLCAPPLAAASHAAAQAGGLIRVDFAPTPQTPSASPEFAPTLSRRALGDPLFDNIAAENLKQALASQIHMPPLTLPQRAVNEIAYLDAEIAASPDDAALLNRRCFWRGLAKRELDTALADCDRAIALKPGTVGYVDQRALILYLQGKYQAALDAYNDALKLSPGYPSSLLMRGYAKGKLGDQAGEEGDIAAARAGQANIESRFQNFGIID